MQTSPSGEEKRKHRTIVVAGNRTQDLLTLSLLLQRFEYEVASANTAAQALEQISSQRPVLLITDLTLPGMSGVDLFRLLRQDIRTAFLPVVFMVPPSDAAAERRCLDMGAAGCIAKPVQAEDLYRTVQEAIEPVPRANIRIDTRLAVLVNNVPLASSEGSCEVDLSEEGMYVPMSKPYPRNRRISVQLRINDRTISAQGAVMHSHLAGQGRYSQSGMGLRFVNMAPQDQEYIRKFIRDEVTRDIRAAMGRRTPQSR